MCPIFCRSERKLQAMLPTSFQCQSLHKQVAKVAQSCRCIISVWCTVCVRCRAAYHQFYLRLLVSCCGILRHCSSRHCNGPAPITSCPRLLLVYGKHVFLKQRVLLEALDDIVHNQGLLSEPICCSKKLKEY